MSDTKLPDHPFVRGMVGLTDWYKAELLTWPDDEILDELFERHGRGQYTLHQKREWARGLAEFRAWERAQGSASQATEDGQGLANEPTARGLTARQILDARAAHYAEGNGSTAIHRRLSVSRSTLFRARQDLGLCPWPTERQG